MTQPRGVTLIELLVTMTILGIIAGVTVPAIRRMTPPDPNNPTQILAESAHAAVTTGRGVHVQIVVNGAMTSAIARPDGGVIADSALGIEPLTGAPFHAR